MNLKIKQLVALLGIALALQACKKDGDDSTRDPDPDPIPEQKHQVQINFAKASIDITKIDSVTVTLQKTGAAALPSQKLTKGTNIYYIDGLDLQNSSWKASLTTYTTKETNNQASHVYNMEKEISKDLLANAPTGKLSDVWLPRLMVNLPTHKIQFIMAERQDDPYFAINSLTPTDWEYIYLEKGIENTNGNVLDGMVYEKSDPDIFPNNKNVVNTIFFTPYCNRMRDKNWEVGSIFIMMFKKGKPEEDITVWHKYNKRAE